MGTIRLAMHIQLSISEKLSFSGDFGLSQAQPRQDSSTANKWIKQNKSLPFGILQTTRLKNVLEAKGFMALLAQLTPISGKNINKIESKF